MFARKTIVLFTTITTFAFASEVSLATGHNEAYMDACRAEIQEYYGEERNLSVVSKRRIAEGTRVKIAARSDSDNAEFIHCWVPARDGADSYDQRTNAVAATVTPVPVIR